MGLFRNYWTKLSGREKRALAKRMETSVNYLSQVAHGHKKPGRQFLALLELRLGSSRQELFMEEAGSGPSSPAAAGLNGRERADGIRAMLVSIPEIDTRLLDSAARWYRQQPSSPATKDAEALIHGCKEKLMQQSGLSQGVCWIHAAFGWDIHRLGHTVSGS
jgi:transcriptional regulator with XRE-family HTH domain